MSLIGTRGNAPLFGDVPLPMGMQAPTSIGGQQIAAPDVPGPGFLQRLQGALQQPGMSQALLRGAAATFDGGLGAGIAAGAQSMDQQHAQQRNDQQQQFENGLAEFKLAQQRQHEAAQLQHQQAEDARKADAISWLPTPTKLVPYKRQSGQLLNPNDQSLGQDPAPTPAAATGPSVGAIQRGFRFRGGDPANPASWEKVGGAPSQGGATFP